MAAVVVALIGLVALAAACDGDDADAARGEELFANNCAACHGDDGRGRPTGPPLVHPLYVPEQTSDERFVVAMQEGASEQHFGFGDMPSVSGLSEAQMAAITEHVRELQRDAGLID